MPDRSPPPALRADQILDAAATLLVRHGYRKVTVDDISREAGIGKGTVYLHWRSKQELFEALFLREAIAYVEGLLDQLRRDPRAVLPHRLLSESFLIVSARPVLRSLVTGDLAPLRSGLQASPLRSADLLATERFFALLTEHGLLRRDVPNLTYVLKAVHSGFYLLQSLDPTDAGLDVHAKAEALAHVIRTACEPATTPNSKALATAAAELITVFEKLIPPYRAWIYGEQPERR
ncbi:TetR/AcrR family transcriptional regulator [Archangium lansingense]|uniref:TetR/AcrR family transcriptional regulator n=1 Tax=Archangium lansingense TaxID=2995310 RepID=A0ABT4AAD2_9BACT|nr:TetR/AcrR family transcriptional regulator [Archangium lansinium]MCY1078291.1 TetR/AcrR family transcriptional regulator [Archangium lansinium]